LAHKIGNAMDQDRSLAGASSGHDQHGPVHMLNRLTLAIIGNKRN
jgi:hypothetical protein